MKNKILLVGIITGFILMMISFSFGDLFAMFYVPNWIDKGNVYDLVRLNKSNCLWLSATWPPLYYLTIGLYLKIIQGLGLLNSDIFMVNSCPVYWLILNKNFLLWAKLPFLIFHFLSAFLFSKFFHQNRKLWFLVWLLNPVAIFISFIQGQYDIIPTFFTMLALYFAKKKNFELSAVSLGIGGAFKFYPFLLALPFILILTNDIKTRLKFGLLMILPYLITITPFLSQSYFESLKFSENYKMLESGLIFGNIKVSFYLLAYFMTLYYIWKNNLKRYKNLITMTLVIISYYFVFTFWFVQRLLFLLPSLLLYSSKEKKTFKILPIFYFCFFIYALIMYPGLFDHSLLRPINQNIKPLEFNLEIFNPQIIQQIVLSGITAFFLIFIFNGFRIKPKKLIPIKSFDIILQISGLIIYLILIIFFLVY